MRDFDNLNLTFSERLSLLRLSFRKRIPEESLHDSAKILVSRGFIRRNYSNEKNEIGESIPDGTYSPTDLCRRYFVYQRRQFTRSFACPLIVAIITALITTLITNALLH